MYPLPVLSEEHKIWDYQLEAQAWMASREVTPREIMHTHGTRDSDRCGMVGGIIKMDMGLGKSLLALYHSFTMQQTRREEFPTLIVSSKTLMYEWKSQGIEKFYPDARVFYYHKDMAKKLDTITALDLRSYNMVFTTYDTLLSMYKKHGGKDGGDGGGSKFDILRMGEGFHAGKIMRIDTRKRPQFSPTDISGLALYNMPWERVICDESQRFANHKTKTFQSIMALYGKWKWCLTGTPIRNYDTDIWSQFRFCGFNMITEARKWRKVTSYNTYNMSRFVYVKDYEDVGVVIPDKQDHVYYVKMTENQSKLYEAYLREMKNMFAELANHTVNMMAILAVFTRLRQVCIAPHIIVSSKNGKKGTTAVNTTATSANKWLSNIKGDAGTLSPKISQIVHIIKNVPSGEKIIIFSMFTSCLRIVEEAVNDELVSSTSTSTSAYVDGTITGEQRHNAIESFRFNPDVTILYIQGKTGSEGLNITAANHIICIEPWWTHAVHNQAIARAWRRGQDKPVHVHWILSQGSIEEEILKMCDNKQGMSDEYIYGTEYKIKNVSLGKLELENMIDRGLMTYDKTTHEPWMPRSKRRTNVKDVRK